MSRITAILLSAPILLLAACTSETPDQLGFQELETEPSTFCTDIARFQTGQVTDPDESFALMDKIIEGAPQEIAEETGLFMNQGRKISQALLPYLPDVTDEEIQEFLANLEPESIEYLNTLNHTAQTGEVPDGPMGVVFTWQHENC